MKLVVSHDRRRPHPEPAPTNDALAFGVGLLGWAVALAITLGMLALGTLPDDPRILSTIAVGLALGGLGLLVSRRRPR
jgi:hypothetical protein